MVKHASNQISVCVLTVSACFPHTVSEILAKGTNVASAKRTNANCSHASAKRKNASCPPCGQFAFVLFAEISVCLFSLICSYFLRTKLQIVQSMWCKTRQNDPLAMRISDVSFRHRHPQSHFTINIRAVHIRIRTVSFCYTHKQFPFAMRTHSLL